jgi:hypothetical protein
MQPSVAAAVAVVAERRASIGDTGAEHIAQPVIQSVALFFGQFCRHALGMQSSNKERFISVDVADPSKERLVEQQRFNPRSPGC